MCCTIKRDAFNYATLKKKLTGKEKKGNERKGKKKNLFEKSLSLDFQQFSNWDYLLKPVSVDWKTIFDNYSLKF